MTDITVMTWNIVLGLGQPISFPEYLLRLARYPFRAMEEGSLDEIVRVIGSVDPALLALQEVDGRLTMGGGPCLLERLGERGSYPYREYAVEHSLLGRIDYGNALLSRYPLNGAAATALPSLVENRNYLSGHLLVDGVDMRIVNTHLGTYFLVGGRERMRQMRSLAEFVASQTCPTIVLGDFNCGPDSEEMRYLLQSTGLRALNGAPTYPTNRPSISIDNILVSGEFSVEEVGLLNDAPSDHLPVYARLRI